MCNAVTKKCICIRFHAGPGNWSVRIQLQVQQHDTGCVFHRWKDILQYRRGYLVIAEDMQDDSENIEIGLHWLRLEEVMYLIL
jgi:hypothetical protein